MLLQLLSDRALGKIRRGISLTIPKGFVVTASGYRRFPEHSGLQSEIDRRIQATETDRPEGLRELTAFGQMLPRLNTLSLSPRMERIRFPFTVISIAHMASQILHDR